jgi:hypothetical protein
MMKYAVAAALMSLVLIAVPATAGNYRDASCPDCPPPRKYDTQEVIKTTRDVDESRVINTTTMVPVSHRHAPRYQPRYEPRYGHRYKHHHERRARHHRWARDYRAVDAYRGFKHRSRAECVDCPPPRKYDSQEVIYTTRDIDHSRVINTQTVIPVSRRVITKNHLIVHDNLIRHVGTVRHNRIIIEKEIRYVRPVETVVNFVVRRYRVVEQPPTYTIEVPAPPPRVRECSYGRRYGRHGSCGRVLDVRG